jgi:F0F1-type ATP synthase assembly protein I
MSGSDEENAKRRFAFRAARYTSLAMALPATVVAGYFIGYALDAWLHTTYLKVVFLILGVVGGMTQLIQLITRDMKRDKTK